MTILTLQQYSIYNVLNGHCKVPAIFYKPFQQLYKYFCNIARFQWNIFEIFLQYYSAMWEVQILLSIKCSFLMQPITSGKESILVKNVTLVK